MKEKELKTLIENLGQRYSEVLGINLSEGEDRNVFKWFLASLLFGAPIRESSAMKTYLCFKEHDVLTPRRILATGWDGLVEILDEGTYTRYDYKTADKLLEVAGSLINNYSGSLGRVHSLARDPRDLEGGLKSLAKGIGDVTVSIFLRELRGVWEKADPFPTEREILAGQKLGIVTKGATAESALRQLKDFWAENRIAGKSFANFETALLRLGKDAQRRSRSQRA
jgi:hypothetical protein